MQFKIVDASAIGALVFNEAAADEVAERLDGSLLMAPWLLLHELDGICIKKIQALPGLRRQLLAARAVADELSITYSAVEHLEVVELAVKTRLSAYDAAYLWLATSRNAELVTLDKRLAAAAK